MGDNCPPKECKHETFHYCNDSGTHCNKHCSCGCEQCQEDRVKPAPLDPEMGGAILPGSNVIINRR